MAGGGGNWNEVAGSETKWSSYLKNNNIRVTISYPLCRISL